MKKIKRIDRGERTNGGGKSNEMEKCARERRSEFALKLFQKEGKG